MSFDVWGEPPDHSQTMAFCCNCAWRGLYQEADYRRPSPDEQEQCVCPSCGSKELEDLDCENF